MNYIKSLVLIFFLFSCSGYGQVYQTALTGDILPVTCVFDEKNNQISLSDIAANAFTDKAIHGVTKFDLAFTCNGDLQSISMRASGVPDSGDPTAFINTGDASGVALRLLDMSGNVLSPAATTSFSISDIKENISKNYEFSAGYVRSGGEEVQVGNFSSQVTITFIYD